MEKVSERYWEMEVLEMNITKGFDYCRNLAFYSESESHWRDLGR